METGDHLQLKALAIRHLRRAGCRALATEVRCPIARFRVDVAGYQDRRPARRPAGSPGPPGRPEAQTVVIECKRSRGDFLRDRAEADRLLAARDELDRLCRRIERHRIRRQEPHLRRSGTSLFPELEEWDFPASRIRGYQRLVRKVRDLERRLHGQTKFFTIARYRLADRLYLLAPRGLLRRGELPLGWGLLECPRRALQGRWADAPLRVAVEAPAQPTRPEHRVRMLRNIAVAASRAALAAAGPGGAVPRG